MADLGSTCDLNSNLVSAFAALGKKSMWVSASMMGNVKDESEMTAYTGDKSEAKALMSAADVPVVPGYHGEQQDTSR